MENNRKVITNLSSKRAWAGIEIAKKYPEITFYEFDTSLGKFVNFIGDKDKDYTIFCEKIGDLLNS